jgi:hypothetical protein
MPLMLDRIKTHNYFNGNVFSLVEFFVASLIVAPFVVYYLLHSRLLMATLGLGIIFNCLTVSFVAMESVFRREETIGIVRFYSDKELRRKAAAENPKLSQDTLVLCVGIVIPFLLSGTALYDWLASRRGGAAIKT